MFHNVNFRYLENFLQRKRKTRRTKERIFRASGGTSFEIFSGCGFHGCIGLLKETLNMLIYIYIYIYINIFRVSLSKPIHPWNPHPEKISKLVPPDALKIRSLVLRVFRFLCKKFSRYLKFTLWNTLFKEGF